MKNIISGIFTIVTLLFGMNETFAQCSCAIPSDSAYEHLEYSDSVFVGKVVEIKKIRVNADSEYKEFDVIFKVETAWKTDLAETVTVRNINSGDSDFKENESYLVFAKVRDNTLSAYIGCCTETKLLSNAAKDLKEFRDKGLKKANIIKAVPKDNGKPNNSMDVRAKQRLCLLRSS
jgi:hypothetical protein